MDKLKFIFAAIVGCFGRDSLRHIVVFSPKRAAESTRSIARKEGLTYFGTIAS